MRGRGEVHRILWIITKKHLVVGKGSDPHERKDCLSDDSERLKFH